MTLKIQMDTRYNACYNRMPTEKTLNVLFLLLAAILGVEIVITTALLYSVNCKINTTREYLHHDVFLTGCLHRQPPTKQTGELASCNLMRRELWNSMNTRLLLEVRNLLWKSLGENNITQTFKPAIHVGVKQELKQIHHLLGTGSELSYPSAKTSPGDTQNSHFMSECLNWEVLGGQSTQEDLMILSPDGEIVVPQKGIYFVYSQVHFLSSSPSPNLQYLFRKTSSYPGLTLLGKAGTSFCHRSDSSVVWHSSHQGALFQLESGDRLSLCVSNMDAVLFQPEATYFGAYMID